MLQLYAFIWFLVDSTLLWAQAYIYQLQSCYDVTITSFHWPTFE